MTYFDSIINSDGISNSFWFSYKLQSDLKIISNWITKLIDNSIFWKKVFWEICTYTLITISTGQWLTVFTWKKSITRIFSEIYHISIHPLQHKSKILMDIPAVFSWMVTLSSDLWHLVACSKKNWSSRQICILRLRYVHTGINITQCQIRLMVHTRKNRYSW